MTTYELFSVALSFMALVVSIIAIAKVSSASNRSNDIASKNLLLAHAHVEMDVSTKIANATQRLHDFSVENGSVLARPDSEMDTAAKQNRELLKKQWDLLEQEYLNAYDEACQKYKDDKTDRTRFKKTYARQIQHIGEDEKYGQRIRHGHDYAALRSVYDEWENHEAK